MVGIISVALAVEHLPTASIPSTISTQAKHPKFILIPNLDTQLSVKSTIKQFIEECLYIPSHLQSISTPLFTRLEETESVEDVYSKYDCNTEADNPGLHFEEDTCTFWGLESGKSIRLQDDWRLQDYHILHKSSISLKILPERLSAEGGRIFVETKDGILPLVGIGPSSRVSELKQRLESMTGIPAAHQLLSSVGRVMHDEFHISDFEGFHAIYEGSIIDLCKSGDSNLDQAHCHLIVFLHASNGQTSTLVVQPSYHVGSIMQIVESRMGIPQWKQRIIFNGKVLQEKKVLADYFIYPECTFHVNILKSPGKNPARLASKSQSEDKPEHLEESMQRPAARKFKLIRTQSGHVKGTLTIPVLTTDKISDLKRKIKKSLQISGERNTATGIIPAKEQQSCPDYVNKKKLSRTSSAIEMLTKQMTNSASSSKITPCKQAVSQTSNSYITTPPQSKDSFFTPPSKLGPPTPASPKTSENKSSLVRKLHFGASSDPPTSAQSPTSPKQPNTPLRQVLPQISRQLSLHCTSAKDFLQRGSGQNRSVVANEFDSENHPNQQIGSKKGIGTWFTENIHNLKGHIRVPFAEK
ncbi:hypothetical protein SUGI_0013880 [Cryptomeria japonica]|uniref:uncharacterized protein LOC131040667 n=1 Tax=Cryptomeria japonica TaxID=3369 RepID=UPI002408CDA3|nr:uncharacterized protein LOC131040667 [Cryptomeria japonica]GLJ05214.1 hypothetical protein SUGI_0013880 [Cryptomeria japonica]